MADKSGDSDADSKTAPPPPPPPPSDPSAYLAAWDCVADVSVNGIKQAGLAAGAEKLKIVSDCLFVGGSPMEAAFSAFLACFSLFDTFPEVLMSIIAAAYKIAEFEWFDDSSYTVSAFVREDDDAVKLKFLSLKARMNSDHFQNGLNLLVATKVNWWQMNHHVGQGSLMGYAKKMVVAKFGEAAGKDRDVYNCVWKLGHWASTRGVLASLGVKEVGSKLREFPEPADDVKIRIRGFPAGTAKVGFCFAVSIRIYMGMFYRIVGYLPNQMSIIELASMIYKHPARFHVGASHLIPGSGRQDCSVAEEDIRFASAYIHALGKGSSLSGSQACMKLDEVKDHEIYTRVTGYVREMQKHSIADEDAMKTLKAQGALTGSMFEFMQAVDNSLLADLGVTKRAAPAIKAPPAEEEKTVAPPPPPV